jgi:Bacterial PH domain
MIVGSDFPGAGSLTWRPRPTLVAVGAVAVAAASIWVLLAGSPLDRVMGSVFAIVLAVLTVLGWRRRLTAGPRGLLVLGTGRPRIVPWSDVRGVDNPTTRRFGIATTTVEIDMIDDDLLVFGRIELGADPADVVTHLREWWRG